MKTSNGRTETVFVSCLGTHARRKAIRMVQTKHYSWNPKRTVPSDTTTFKTVSLLSSNVLIAEALPLLPLDLEKKRLPIKLVLSFLVVPAFEVRWENFSKHCDASSIRYCSPSNDSLDTTTCTEGTSMFSAVIEPELAWDLMTDICGGKGVG